MTRQENRENGVSRLGPRPVEFLRQALHLRKARTCDDRSTDGESVRPEGAVGTAAGQALTIAASEFPWEQFPNPVHHTFDLSVGSTTSQPAQSRNEVKPQGPSVEELERVVAAMKRRNRARRALWRKSNLDFREREEKQKQKLLAGDGRVNEAEPDTQEAYVRRGRGLISRYKHEQNIRAPTEDIDLRIFANWVLSLKSPSKEGTWRNYRQAATTVIRTIPSIHIEEAIGILNEDLQVGADEGRSRGGQADGVPKGFAKRMDHEHFLRLRQAVLDLKPSKVGFALRHWLEAGIHTGLRPMEWEAAFIEKSRLEGGFHIWLHVVAARGDDGECTFRSLDITTFGRDAKESVQRMVELSRTWTSSAQFAVWQREVNKKLRAICEELFPRMILPYTLWSLRYQFIANMSSIYNREQVAAMTNYATTGEKAEHYRKRRPYWRKNEMSEVPVPVAEQVARMETRLRFLDQRLEIQSMKEVVRRRKMMAVVHFL